MDGGRGTKSDATANLQIELLEYDPQKLPEWGEEFFEFFVLTGEQQDDVTTKCTPNKICAK